MSTLVMEQRKRLHPHKFTLWVAIASITMMFAGLTSAYIVKKSQAHWLQFDLPKAFWYSTATIIVSSITIILAQRKFKDRDIAGYKKLITATFILGLTFLVLQVIGFKNLADQGLTLQSNVAVSFLYVIVCLHALHVVGGIIALMVMFIKAFSKSVKNYSAVPIEVMGTYWHFVDLLWVYLLLFLLLINK